MWGSGDTAYQAEGVARVQDMRKTQAWWVGESERSSWSVQRSPWWREAGDAVGEVRLRVGWSQSPHRSWAITFIKLSSCCLLLNHTLPFPKAFCNWIMHVMLSLCWGSFPLVNSYLSVRTQLRGHLLRKAFSAPTSTEQLWWIAGKTMTVQITWSPTPGKSQVADWHDNLSKMNVHSYCVNYK